MRITSYTVDSSHGDVTADWSATGAPTVEYKLVTREINTLETTVIVDWSTTTTSASFEVGLGDSTDPQEDQFHHAYRRFLLHVYQY